MAWQSVKVRSERYEQIKALAGRERRSVANMVDLLIVRGLRGDGALAERGDLAEPPGELDAAAGFCVHRVKLDSFCKKCAAGE